MDPPNYTTHNGDICLVDYATTHTILWNKKYFSNLTFASINVNTISSFVNLIQGFGRAIIILLGGIKFIIDDALYSAESKRNFFSFKDIRWNGYHIKTMNKNNIKYLYITSFIFGQKHLLQKVPIFIFIFMGCITQPLDPLKYMLSRIKSYMT